MAKRITWNISARQRAEIVRFLDGFNPNNLREQRDKKILSYAFVEDMCASAIQRLNDPIIVSTSNRSMGKPLSTVSILRIIHAYFPNLEPARQWNRKSREERLELAAQKRKNMISAYKRCAKCGSKNDLELHHMIPIFMGGTNNEANLIYLCKSCHSIVTAYQKGETEEKRT